jgi:Flp pilus assembly protein TadB
MNNDAGRDVDREKESALEDEIEHFRREKERIRAIVGKIGGVPTFRQKLLNFVFAFAIAACFAVSLLTHGRLTLSMIEVGIVLISLKIMWLLHSYSRQMHFMFWVLSGLEWRLNEIVEEIKGRRR